MRIDVAPLVQIFDLQWQTLSARLHAKRVPTGFSLSGHARRGGERLGISGTSNATGSVFSVTLTAR